MKRCTIYQLINNYSQYSIGFLSFDYFNKILIADSHGKIIFNAMTFWQKSALAKPAY